jgi:hypothetical protein
MPCNRRKQDRSAESVTGGRDAGGRFTKGNPGGPGNPFARRTAALRKAMVEAVSEEDICEIVQVMKKKAKEGDVAAAKLVLSYVVGRPAEAANPDSLDEDEMRQYLRQPALAEGMPGVLRTIDPATCCTIVRTARPEAVAAMRDQMAEALFSGRVPGTDEQVCPALDPRDDTSQDMKCDEAAPSGNGDNGPSEVGVVSSEPKRMRRRETGVETGRD